MTTVNRSWLEAIELELKDNILSFWMNNTIDEQHGGFIGEISQDMTIHADADKGLVLNARILWTFSAAYRLFGNEQYLQVAKRAYQYLTTHFHDHEYGGLYWMVDVNGKASQDKKQIYGQSFVIYAVSEYYRATGDENALAYAIELFRTVEKYGYDPLHKGYWEALSREWQETDDYSLSGKDRLERKSMNTHLHVLEAYTNLYRVWQSDELRVKLKELIEITMDHIIDADSAHFILFFNEEWEVKSDLISYGHDIEGSWLLHEAAEVLGDEELLAAAKKAAIRMAEVTYAEGVDADGGLLNEADSTGLIDTNKDWWPQAEAVVGFFNAYQLTGDTKFLEASEKSWSFIDQYIVDKANGEWYWSVTRDGIPTTGHPKAGVWKCPYHNARACFELIERGRDHE